MNRTPQTENYSKMGPPESLVSPRNGQSADSRPPRDGQSTASAPSSEIDSRPPRDGQSTASAPSFEIDSFGPPVRGGTAEGDLRAIQAGAPSSTALNGGRAGLRQLVAPRRRRRVAARLQGTALGGRRLGHLSFDAIAVAAISAIVGLVVSEPIATGEGLALALFGPLMLATLLLKGAYRATFDGVVLDRVGQILSAALTSAIGLLALLGVLGVVAGSQLTVLALAAAAFVGLSAVALVRWRQRHQAAPGARGTLIVGSGLVARDVSRRLSERPEHGLRPVGFLEVDCVPSAPPAEVARRLSEATARLEGLVAEQQIEHVVFAFSSTPDRLYVPLMRTCEQLGLEVTLVPRFFGVINRKAHLEYLGGMPLLRTSPVRPDSWAFAAKHAVDFTFALAAIVALSPLLAVIALCVKLSPSSSVLFRQVRVGRDGRTFEMLKFCTMTGDPSEAGQANAEWAARALGDHKPAEMAAVGASADRRTRIGGWLRDTSLDELPQLFNVLRGEMSLVGPRPELPGYVDRFETAIDRYGERHRVRAGLTGWSQVHGLRGETSLARRVELDNYYIENWNPWLDVKIVLMTCVVAFRNPVKDSYRLD